MVEGAGLVMPASRRHTFSPPDRCIAPPYTPCNDRALVATIAEMARKSLPCLNLNVASTPIDSCNARSAARDGARVYSAQVLG